MPLKVKLSNVLRYLAALMSPPKETRLAGFRVKEPLPIVVTKLNINCAWAHDDAKEIAIAINTQVDFVFIFPTIVIIRN